MTTFTITEKEVKGLVASYVQLTDGYTNLFVLIDSIMALLNEKDLVTYVEIREKVVELTDELNRVSKSLKEKSSGDLEKAIEFSRAFGGSKVSDS